MKSNPLGNFEKLLACDRMKLQILKHLYEREISKKGSDSTYHIAKSIGKPDNNAVKNAVLFLERIKLVSIDRRKVGDTDKPAWLISLTESGRSLLDTYKNVPSSSYEEKQKKLGLVKASSS